VAEHASYVRTIKADGPPSEWVVTLALRSTWSDFLRVSPASFPLKKFLRSKLDPNRCRNHEAFELDQAA
jgi:hypothetical protein